MRSLRLNEAQLNEILLKAKARTRTIKTSSDQEGRLTEGVALLLKQIEEAGLPEPVLEYRFDEIRRWRFDAAWVSEKVSIEVNGGVYSGGRHVRGKGIEGDMEKKNSAQMQGWMVLEYSTGQVKAGYAIRDLRSVFK